MRVLKEN